MSETTETVQSTEQQTQTATSPFSREGWTESTPTVAEQTTATPATTEVAETKPVETPQVTTTEEEIIEPKEWLKREFETDDVELLKKERAEYKKLKETVPTDFANEDSKKLYELVRAGKTKEVRQILDTQEKLATLTSVEVNDDSAADIIKLGMQLKYKDLDLSPEEIEYKYNKQFSLPAEPRQREDELEDEFAARKEQWQEQVNDVKMNRNIEAKLAKPELEKLKSEIVLPELEKPAQQANEPTAEQIEAAKKIRENFLQKLDSDYAKAEGFTTKVKDESVDFPVTFKIPDEAKVAIKERLKEGFDINSYIDKRWFDDNGNPKIEQMVSDLFQLENPDKILSGVANNAANQRLEAYIKSKSNVNLNSNSYQQTFNETSGTKQVSPFAKEGWSEKPPVLVNN